MELNAYRKEIDGLRSIAVLSVVFFHFSIPGFTGGFVGVDVFFVISGFLIGGILWRELSETGTIRLSRFYTRRIKRLAPAYFTMAAVSLVFASFILLPFEFREFGKALIASTIYLSNVLFYRQSGYFDGSAEDKVLLHTWSLSVEEQFYLFLPFLIVLVLHNKRILMAVLPVLFVISLIGGIVMTTTSHTAAFYLFPGFLALAPVLGAALLIFNGQHQNLVNRVLSARGPVFVGLISYSLYLWHWPVLTLSGYWRDGYKSLLETAGWMMLAFWLAWLSWRFVEHPIRAARKLPVAGLIGGALIASVLLVGAGGVIFRQNGMPARFGPDARVHINASADFLQDWSRCAIEETGPLQGQEVCRVGPEGRDAEVLIWGDSHLRAFMDGLAQAALEHDTAGLLVWRAGCPPLFGLSKTENTTTRQEDATCLETNRQMRAAIPELTDIKRLLLVGRWSYYAEGAGIGLDRNNTIALQALPNSKLTGLTQSELFRAAVADTFDELAPNFEEIFVLRQVPEIPDYDSRQIARDMAHGRLQAGPRLNQQIAVSKGDLTRRVTNSEQPFLGAERDGRIVLLNSWRDMCDPNQCSALQNGISYYFDNNHVTNAAARRMRDLFGPFLTGTFTTSEVSN